MSAALTTFQNSPAKSLLSDGQNVTSTASLHIIPLSSTTARTQKFKNHVSRLTAMETELLGNISSLTDDELFEVRASAAQLGVHNWRIEIACDAEIWNRAEAKRGRGNVDTEQNGIKANLVKRAKQLGCSTMTIRRNANIHKTFSPEIINNAVTVLPDKGYYIAAASSAKPMEALERFINHKRANPRFSTADAARLVVADRKRGAAERATFVENNREPQTKALEDHLQWAITEVERIKAACPDKMIVQRFYLPFIQDLREQLDTMFLDDASTALRIAWAQGCHREDQLAERTGLPRQEVARVMRQLEEEGEFYQVEQRGETEMAKGGHVKLWHRWNEPLGDGRFNKTSKRAE